MRVEAHSKRRSAFRWPARRIFAGNGRQSAFVVLSIAVATAVAALAQSNLPEPAFRIDGHRSEILSVQFLPFSDDQLLTGSYDSLVTWTATQPTQPRRLVDSDRLLGFSLSPDGSRVTVATLSGARIIEVQTGEVEMEFDREQLSQMVRPEWSPTGDLIATRTRTAIHLWNPATGELQRSLDLGTLGARGPVQVAWSPNGQRIAALGRVGALNIYRVEGGTVEFQTQAHQGVAAHIAWSPDGSLVATGGNDGLVKLWKASDWTLSQALLNEGNILINGRTPIDAIAFSADSSRIAVAVAGASLRVWSTAEGEELIHWSNSGDLAYEPHRGQVTDLAFSPDGRRLASAGNDRTVKIWSVEDGTQLAVHYRFLNSAAAVAWSANGSRYAAASLDGTATVWDEAAQPLGRFEGHLAGRVHSLSFAPAVPRLVTAGADGTVRVWYTRTGAQLFDLPALEADAPRWAMSPRPIAWVAYSPGSNRVAMISDIVGGREDLETRVVAASVGPPRDVSYSVQSAAWSPDGRQIAAASTYVEIVDFENPEAYPTILEKPGTEGSSGFRHVAWSVDGERVLAASRSAGATAWDWRTGRVVAEVMPVDGAVYVEESPDGSLLLTISGTFRSPAAQVWERDSQTELAAIVKERPGIAEVRFLLDGEKVLTRYSRYSRDSPPSVWDARTGEELFALEGHSRPVLGIAVSSDGQLIATGGADQTVRLWDAGTGREEAVLDGHPAAVQGVEFSPDGRFVAAYGRGGATVWQVGPEPASAGSRAAELGRSRPKLRSR